MRFELHCHSTCSDGTEAPARVAARAAARGVDVFALTDHDTCEATGLAVEGARSVRAVEVSCEDGGRTIHVLMYERPQGDWAALEARLAQVRTARVNRLRVMAAKLFQRGIRVDVEPIIEAARTSRAAAEGTRSVGRPDLARAMVAAGYVTSIKEAFSRHLYDGGPIDVKHHALKLAEAVALGRDAGAALSLAHPHLYDDRAAGLLRAHRPNGLTGIEAFYGAYNPGERARWQQVADSLGLVCTGGSDWHGPDDSNIEPGIDLPEARSDALLRWLDA